MDNACEVCGGSEEQCAFEVGCSCWYGVPCLVAKLRTEAGEHGDLAQVAICDSILMGVKS